MVTYINVVLLTCSPDLSLAAAHLYGPKKNTQVSDHFDAKFLQETYAQTIQTYGYRVQIQHIISILASRADLQSGIGRDEGVSGDALTMIDGILASDI